MATARNSAAAIERSRDTGWIVLVAATLLLVLIVQRRSLFAFFHADDLVHLQQAAGLLPTPALPWRFLTQVLYFRGMLGAFGPAPVAFMAVNLIVHAANLLMILTLARRLGAPRPAALLAIVLFGACPLFYTVIGHAVILNDILALAFTLGSLLALHRVRGEPLSLALFALAILSKESVLFLPLLAIVPPFGSPRGDSARRARPLLLMVAAVTVAFVVARATGNAPAGTAYELRFGSELFHNLMTYVAWPVRLDQPIPDLVRSLDPDAWRVGVPLLAALGLASFGRSSLAALVRFGLVWCVLGLLPVLPLLNSAYAHYLYVALPGLALAVAAAVVRALGWVTRSTGWEALAPLAVALFAGFYAIRADGLIQRRGTLQVSGIALPLDPQVRSMEVARRAVLSLRSPPFPPGSRLALFAPEGVGRVFGARTGSERRPLAAAPYDLLEVTFGGGQAFRVFFPQIDTVVFVSNWSSLLSDYELALRTQEGPLLRFGVGAAAHERAGAVLLRAGSASAAGAYFDSIHVLYPGNRRLRLFRAIALDANRRRDEAVLEARALLGGAAGDTVSSIAAELLTRWKAP